MESTVLDTLITDSTGAPVGYYDFGDPAGKPVFALHGVPASGAGFSFAELPARARGLRIIAPDRPGIGRSAHRSSWSVGDYPAMLGAFADALGVDRFSIWGYSGGGPYAAACAALVSDRLDGVAICAPMGELGVFAELSDFAKTDRQLLELATTKPGRARRMMATAAWLAKRSPKSALKSFANELDPSDQAVLAAAGDPAEVMAMFTQAFQNGARGVVADYAALSKPWGVDLSTAEVDVTVWHGTADRMVPLRHSTELVARLPHATLTTWEGEGHLGTITHAADILDTLT